MSSGLRPRAGRPKPASKLFSPGSLCGGWTHLPLGPWAIASRARAVVIPGFVLRARPGKYRIIFHDPILPREGTFRRQMEEMQAIFSSHLEEYLKASPEQWGVLQPFWDA